MLSIVAIVSVTNRPGTFLNIWLSVLWVLSTPATSITMVVTDLDRVIAIPTQRSNGYVAVVCCVFKDIMYHVIKILCVFRGIVVVIFQCKVNASNQLFIVFVLF
jgi:hypothetical protein